MRTGNITTIGKAKRLNKAGGFHFFDADALRFFSSIVYPQMYGGRLFITSERVESRHGNGPRLWTVRAINDDGSVDTVGKFQEHKTHAAAKRAARALVDAVLAGGE